MSVAKLHDLFLQAIHIPQDAIKVIMHRFECFTTLYWKATWWNIPQNIKPEGRKHVTEQKSRPRSLKVTSVLQGVTLKPHGFAFCSVTGFVHPGHCNWIQHPACAKPRISTNRLRGCSVGATRNLATDEVDPPEQLMHATRPWNQQSRSILQLCISILEPTSIQKENKYKLQTLLPSTLVGPDSITTLDHIDILSPCHSKSQCCNKTTDADNPQTS